MGAIGVYEIRNKINGKCYIGSSIHLDYRYEEHVYLLNRGQHHSPHLQASWLKYGPENFEFRVLVETVLEDLKKTEQEYLDKLQPFGDSGYNVARFVEGGMRGCKHTEASRQKMRDAQRGKPKPWQKNRPGFMTGRHHSPESRLKMSQSHAGKPRPWLRGKVFSLELRKRLSEAHKGQVSNRKGTKHTPEAKAKMAAASRGRISTRRRLLETQVREIRASDLGKRRLAKQFGVSRGTIKLIRDRKTYADIT